MSDAPAYEEFGTYRLTHLLGKGGMASVYRAVRSGPMGFAKEVAIKRIHDALLDNEAILKGLINEARIGGQLKHPNIVEIYEFNKVGDTYYLAMEFVDGWTLDRVAKLSREFKMPVPASVVLEIGRQLCDGLEYAHNLESLDGQEVKLVHRDMKPANIILSRYGTAKIMDFGIAKAETNLFKTTMADVTKGTPHYMSPEQVAGAADLSGTSDLFAMGSLLYELTTGKVLFVGDALPTVLFNVVKAEVGPQIAEADERVAGLGEILEGLLKKDPKERPQSAGEVGKALTALREGPHADGPTIKQFLYTLRDRMVLGATRSTAQVNDDPTVADQTMPQLDDEPEFATMLAPSQRPDPSGNEGLVEARAAADAAIGSVGKVFASTGALDVDTSSETHAAVPSQAAARSANSPPATTLRAKDGPKATHPNQKATRKIRKKKPRRSPALLLVVALLGLVLASTLGWIVKETLFSSDPVEPPAPEVAEPVDLSIPDLEFPTPKPTPKPRVRTPDPTPKPVLASANPTPAPSAEATPTAVPEDLTPAPEPPTAAAVVVAEPTPEPVAVVAAVQKGKGRVSIKTSTPYYARVWIDGIDTGKSTPLMGLELPAGKHSVELVADQQKRRSAPRTVSITADGHVKLGHYDFDTKTWDN
ncbi:MAG: serine/threonine protein kinase [Deltaproteobacteria bacterium]|nr:serine/threonine protein kinase [Deltaproteobacteria bacterium]